MFFVPLYDSAGFKQAAKKHHKVCDDLADVPLNWIQGQIAKGEAGPSYTHDLLMDKNISEERMERIKWSSASFYGAGADTVSSYHYFSFISVELNDRSIVCLRHLLLLPCHDTLSRG